MSIIGSKGAELDILIRQGATFGPYRVTLTNPNNTAVDLTGAVIRAQVRKTPNALLSEAISAQVDYVNRTGGIFTFEFSAESTASLTAGLDEFAPESQYVWDLELQDSTGRVLPLLYGVARIFREVTKTI